MEDTSTANNGVGSAQLDHRVTELFDKFAFEVRLEVAQVTDMAHLFTAVRMRNPAWVVVTSSGFAHVDGVRKVTISVDMETVLEVVV